MFQAGLGDNGILSTTAVADSGHCATNGPGVWCRITI